MIANQSTKEKITGLFINCEGRQRGEHYPSLLETEIDDEYEPEYTKNMFLQLVRIDVLVCTWHAGFLTATLVFDAIEEDGTRIHNYFTNGMSFAEVESNDMRIGDFFDAYPYDFGDALHVDYENRKRTRNLPQWQPPTLCPKCGGELQSQFGDIVCKTVFETGTH